jgi:hypothetical protein
MQNRSHHGYGEKTFQITVRVIIEDTNRIALGNAQFFQAGGKPGNPFI